MPLLKTPFRTDIMDLMKYRVSDSKALGTEHEVSGGARRKARIRQVQNPDADAVSVARAGIKSEAETEFLDDALGAGIPLVMLASYSRNGEDVSRCIAEKLGSERMNKIKIVGQSEVENSFYGQLVLGKGVSASLDEHLANEAAKAVAAEKQRVAKEVASMLKLSVEVDTKSSEMSKKVIASLRAGMEYAGMPVQSCILLAGSQTGVLAAERIGMPCIVVRSSSTSRAEFPSARAVVEGFGAGDMTISRLCRMLSS